MSSDNVIRSLKLAFQADSSLRPPTKATTAKLIILLAEVCGKMERAERLEFIRDVTGLRKLGSFKQITQHTACVLIDYLLAEENHMDIRTIMERARMKTTLARTRVNEKGQPICALCDMPITDEGMDMHEALVTRGDNLSERDIYTRENCALVHHGDCHIAAGTKSGQRKVAAHLVEWEGREAIENWLSTIYTKNPATYRTAMYYLAPQMS